MKTFIFATILLLISSCAKDKVKSTEESVELPPIAKHCIIVGNTISNDVQFTNYAPHISLMSNNQSVYHDIDINSDGILDFQFEVLAAYPLAGGWFNGCYVSIKTLSPEAQISLDTLLGSTVVYPKQYTANDSLFQSAEWQTGEYTISSNGDDPNDSCFGPGCPNISYGMWFGTTDKYIGVRLNTAIPSLGWIKISLPSTNVNYGQILIIEEYGHIP